LSLCPTEHRFLSKVGEYQHGQCYHGSHFCVDYTNKAVSLFIFSLYLSFCQQEGRKTSFNPSRQWVRTKAGSCFFSSPPE
jgi:hypothetical protein